MQCAVAYPITLEAGAAGAVGLDVSCGATLVAPDAGTKVKVSGSGIVA